MKNKVKTRNSNYELMRIISMFMVLVTHIIAHGKLIENSTGSLQLILQLIKAICIVHVNSFILVSGYYMCKSKFKLSKVLHLIFTVWIYQAIVVAFGSYVGWYNFTLAELVRELSPFNMLSYWFIKIYLLVYCISPFLNILIDNLDKKTYKRLILVSFFLFSILITYSSFSSFSYMKFYTNAGGFSVLNMVFLYMIGAYFQKFPISTSYIFKKNSNSLNQIIFISLFIGCFIINFLLLNFGNLLSTMDGNTIKTMGKDLLSTIFSYDSPFVILGSVFYFLWFGTLNIKNKIINKAASAAFDVYIEHDNENLKPYLYKYIGFSSSNVYTSLMTIPKLFVVSIFLYIVLTLVGLIRIKLFYYISKTKIFRWIKNKLFSYLNNIGEFEVS